MARRTEKEAVLKLYLDGVRSAVPQAEIQVLDDPPRGADFLVSVEVPEGHLMEAIETTSGLTTDLYLKSGVYVDVWVGEQEEGPEEDGEQ